MLHGPLRSFLQNPGTTLHPGPGQVQINNIMGSGRLRKLSQSFKASAFGHSNSSSPSPTQPSFSPPSQSQIIHKDPSTHLQVSSADPPRSNSRGDRTSARPTSMIYVSPPVDVGRDNHVEELVPVFRQGLVFKARCHWSSADYTTVSCQVIPTSCTKKVLTGCTHAISQLLAADICPRIFSQVE